MFRLLWSIGPLRALVYAIIIFGAVAGGAQLMQYWPPIWIAVSMGQLAIIIAIARYEFSKR